MKNKLITVILSLLALTFFMNCEAKTPVDKFGLTPDEYSVALLGVISNIGMVDNGAGSVLDTTIRLEWRKCSVGQVFRAASNDCQGRTQGSALTPLDQFRYGAGQFAYCTSRTHACNRVGIPQVLVGASEVGIAGTSELFSACNLGDNWRVATSLELLRLTATGRNAVLARFPSTVEGTYWSGWSEETDLPGETAKAVSFDRESFGEEKKLIKTDRNYARCVRNY